MKFLVDAQLPTRLARFLSSSGHDALHTLELPDGNRTTDARIAEIADGSDRVVVTKDRDFRDSHLLTRSPRRLLVVATGNITNDTSVRSNRCLSDFQGPVLHTCSVVIVLGLRQNGHSIGRCSQVDAN